MEMEKIEILNSDWNGRINCDWAGGWRSHTEWEHSQEWIKSGKDIFILIDRNKVGKKESFY